MSQQPRRFLTVTSQADIDMQLMLDAGHRFLKRLEAVAAGTDDADRRHLLRDLYSDARDVVRRLEGQLL